MKSFRTYLIILKQKLLNNPGLKIFSLIAACALWFFVVNQEKAEKEINKVSWQIRNMPQNMEIVEINSSSVSIRIRGLRSILTSINTSAITANLELPTDVSEGVTSLSLTADRISGIPAGVDVVDVSPSVIDVRLEKTIQKEVGIRPDIRGRPAEGYQLMGFRSTPERVRVSGPVSYLENIEGVVSEPIDISGVSSSFTQRVLLKAESEKVRFVDKNTALIFIEIKQRIEEKLVMVQVIASTGFQGIEFKPTRVEVLLKGPAIQLRKIDETSLWAGIELSEYSPGEYEIVPEIKDLPRGIEALQIIPRKVNVMIPAIPTQVPAAQEEKETEAIPEKDAETE